MNNKDRKEQLNKILKEAKLKKIAEDINDATDAGDFSEKLFNKLLEEIKIEGLED